MDKECGISITKGDFIHGVTVTMDKNNLSYVAEKDFKAWLSQPLKTIDNITVGESMRRWMHEKLDAWIDKEKNT